MVTGITISRIQDPKAKEVNQSAKVAADALFDHSRGVISCLGCGGDKALFKALHLALAQGTAKGAHLWVAIDVITKDVVGTIAAYEPGKTIMGDDTQKKEGFNEFLNDLPPNLRFFWAVTAPNVLAGLDKLINEGLGTSSGKKEVWAVNSFAVKKDWRKKGIGKALMEAVEKAAKEGLKPSDERQLLCETSDKTNLTIAEHLEFTKLKTVTPDFPQMFLPEFTILSKKVKAG